MSVKRDKMMKYLENIKFGILSDKDFQTNCEINYQEIKNGTNEFVGCPQNCGLPEAKSLCEGKDDSKLTQKEILDSCMECWKLALLDNISDSEYSDDIEHDTEISPRLLEQFSLEEIQEMCNYSGKT